jgi:hypothetical protein
MNILHILQRFDNFSDGLIGSANYNPQKVNDGILNLSIKCYDGQHGFRHVELNLLFSGVSRLRIIALPDYSNASVFEAFGKKKEMGEYLLDFFPKYVTDTLLEEDPDSFFSLHFEKVELISCLEI